MQSSRGPRLLLLASLLLAAPPAPAALRAQNAAALALTPLYDVPSPSGCAGETMTMRQDAAGRPYLYVAAKDAGLRIYDIAAQPKLVKTIAITSLGSLDVMSLSQSGSRLFLALGDHFPRSTDPAAESPGLAVVDVSDPTAPAILDLWSDPTLEGGAAVVAIEGGYAYLGAMGNGLVIFKVSAAGPAAWR